MADNLEILAKQAARNNDFKIEKKIYQAYYYGDDNFRNVIYSGSWLGKPAVLKVYSDPQLNDEPVALATFNQRNKSKILIAPRLYKYKVINPRSGWLIMEKLPASARHYDSPISSREQTEFLKLFLEYRRNFPAHPTRNLSLLEHLPANVFHINRIDRWFRIADNKQAGETEPIIKAEEFIPRYRRAIRVINQELAGRRMVWCHGHFKPKEIFKVNSNLYYLTDFAHVNLYPEGYELAFIIWADYLMAADWCAGCYGRWNKGIFSWIDKIEKIVAKELKIKNYWRLIRVSLIERIMGAILLDVSTTDKSKAEKIGRIKMLYKLFDDLI